MSVLYIKVENGAPVGHPMLADTVRGLLETSTLNDAFAKQNGYFPFQNIDVPDTHDIKGSDGYELGVDEVVRPKLVIVELSLEEKRDRFIRPNRDRLLFLSDWTQMSDSPLSAAKKEEWAEYRQELRELPDTYPNAIQPEDIVWPTTPE